MVTVFINVYDKVNPNYINHKILFEYIKNGRWVNKIHQLRQATLEADKKRYKAHLPSICWSGTFPQRFDEKITKHSGLVILDFDHIENLKEFKEKICKDEFTYSAFISPSGDGLKVLVKIPPVIEDHEKHYMALIKKYPSLDTTSKNISRVCFASYDPEIYVNENSKIFTEKGKLVEKKEIKVINAQDTDYAKLNIALNLIRNSTDGNKHQNLIKASRLCGGFIAGGIVEEFETTRILELEINKKDIVDFNAACKTIQDGIEYGKKEPIYEKTIDARYEEIVKQEIIIEDEPAKDVIYLNDIKDKIIYSYENGTSRGETTHFPDIDEHFRWKRGEITLWHGIGNHGKSSHCYQLALMKSVKDNYKWGIFSPENMPEEEFYKDLIHSYVGKSTERHHANQMSRSELLNAMEFIHEHFFLIYPENNEPTPDYINSRFRELVIKHNIDGCIIDPYNQLDNDMSKNGGRDDQYLSKFLTNCKRFAVQQDVFFVIVSHPKGGLQKEGLDYSCPNVFDLSGGAMWNNKCDNIVVTHRPFKTSDPFNSAVYFKSQKIKKQKLNGVPGDVLMSFDVFQSRYKQQDGFNPLNTSSHLTRFTPQQTELNEPDDAVNFNIF